MNTFGDFMIAEATKKDAELASLRTANAELLKALNQISGLWPEPPHCAEINPEWVGERDGKTRAILLEAAIEISRKAIAKAKEQLHEGIR